jgi:hypothetical protein
VCSVRIYEIFNTPNGLVVLSDEQCIVRLH